MKVFAGDQFHSPSDASYKNLFWENLPVPLIYQYTPTLVSLENKLHNQSFLTNRIMNNFQVTVPGYRENTLIMPFSMLCPGISQNTKHHQLTLYKGQEGREKSYVELCNHNVLNIALSHVFWNSANGELYVPPAPSRGFINEETKIPLDSEIVQSFAKLTNITRMTYHSYDSYSSHIQVGNFICRPQHHRHCVPPSRYVAKYIWTKEGFKRQIYLFRFNVLTFTHYIF